MQSILYVMSVVAFFMLSASNCEDPFYFAKPQPDHTKNRSGLDADIQGTYLFTERNFVYEEFFDLESKDLKEFLDTLSRVLALDIRFMDSIWLKVEDVRIIKRRRQNLVFEKQSLQTYFEHLQKLKDLESVRTLLCTPMFRKFFEIDSVFLEKDVLYIVSDEDTSFVHYTEEAYYVIDYDDTLAVIGFESDLEDPPSLPAGPEFRIMVSDSSLCVWEGDSTRYDLCFTDTRMHLYKNDSIDVEGHISPEALCLITDNDTIVCRASGDHYDHYIGGDTDTMFTISHRHVLRKYKKDWYLNFRRIKTDTCWLWDVYQLASYEDGITLSYVNDTADLVRLDEITGVEKDTTDRKTTYYADPSRREFRKFLKAGGFFDTEWYRRQ